MNGNAVVMVREFKLRSKLDPPWPCKVAVHDGSVPRMDRTLFQISQARGDGVSVLPSKHR